MVPMPSEVNTSSSSEWGWRPSMTWACGHALLDGADAGLQLGDHARVHPREQVLRAPSTDSDDSSESRSGQSA